MTGAFMPITTPTARTCDSLMMMGSDDFSKIFGAQEAFERRRENAANYVAPTKRGVSNEEGITPKDMRADLTNTTKVSQSGDKD